MAAASGSNTDSHTRAGCEPKYQHQPLEHDDSIRLLKLEPAPMPTSELYGQLILARLSANPAYAAVSYTWGDPVFPKVLNLAGGGLKITENLDSALRAFRDRRQPRMLWVDGVCIDQASPDDKNHQVALMSEIYRGAHMVLGWLGDETPESGPAIRCLRHLARSETTEESFGIVMEPQESNSSEEIRQVTKAVESCNLDSIYGRPWFSRLWVVQEVVLARKLVLRCGPDELYWQTFASAMKPLVRVRNTVKLSIPDLQSFQEAVALKESRAMFHLSSNPERFTILEEYRKFGSYVHEFSRRQCQDDRDRVYALLSLRHPDSKILIQPDYTKSVVEVYVDFATQHLELGETFFLYYAGLWLRKRDPEDSPTNATFASVDRLPSWAQEHRPSKLNGASLAWYPDMYSRFDASGGSSMRAKRSPNSSHKITIMGKLFAEVENTLFLKDPSTIRIINTLCNMMEACKNLCDRWPKVRANYPSPEDLTVAFARTILADGSTSKNPRNPWNAFSPEVALELWHLFENQCLSEESEIYQKSHQIYADEASLDISSFDLSSSIEIPKRFNPALQRVWDYCRKLVRLFYTCQFITTETGRIGLAPMGTQYQDTIAILDGISTPFILRQVRGTADYELIGPCYLHGIMYGEATSNPSDGGKGSEWITLV